MGHIHSESSDILDIKIAQFENKELLKNILTTVNASKCSYEQKEKALHYSN